MAPRDYRDPPGGASTEYLHSHPAQLPGFGASASLFTWIAERSSKEARKAIRPTPPLLEIAVVSSKGHVPGTCSVSIEICRLPFNLAAVRTESWNAYPFIR